ncbi:hypothetical protein Tco_1244773 [Tanacetum coccineum]
MPEKVVKMPLVIWRVLRFKGENELIEDNEVLPLRRIGCRMELVQEEATEKIARFAKARVVLTSLEKAESGWNDCRKFARVHGDDVAKTVFRMRNGHVEVYDYAFWVNQCTSGFHGVNESGGVRVAHEDDRGVSEGREDVREVFQQRGSGAKRKLSRCGRNQMGNEPILALPEGADDFVVYYDARSKDLEACLEKGEGDCLLTNRWLSMKKDIASCGSTYLAYSEVEVEYQGSSGLLLQPELLLSSYQVWGLSFEYGCASFEACYHTSIKCAPFEALYGRKCRSPLIWTEVVESQLIGPELIQEMTEKIFQIKERLKSVRSRQKSYADKRRKPLEFKVGDRVLLKVSPWKGVVRFGKKGKLAPRYVGPFKIMECVGPLAYRLKLPQELSCVHDTFHVSNLKKCLAEPDVQVPLDEIEIDENLRFVEEPIEIVERDVKKLKRRRIPLVKVRWNSRQGAEYTWEHEDQFRKKYPHLFSKPVLSSNRELMKNLRLVDATLEIVDRGCEEAKGKRIISQSSLNSQAGAEYTFGSGNEKTNSG